MKCSVYIAISADGFIARNDGSVDWRPKELVVAWVDAFNARNAELISSYNHDDAINHQTADGEAVGKKEIQHKFVTEFSATEMVCIVENILEDGDWTLLEWKDPVGLRGCGFFHVQNGKILFQRRYWDKLSFLRQPGLPIPKQ